MSLSFCRTSGRTGALSLLAGVLTAMAPVAWAAEPNVGPGTWTLYLSSIHLLPSETLGGQMASIVSCSYDRAFHQSYLEPGRPDSDAQTLLSVIYSGYDFPILDLMLESNYTNVPINAGVTVGAVMNYRYVAYKKIAIDIPSDVRVPLKMSGAVEVWLTNPGQWDSAFADVCMGSVDGDVQASVSSENTDRRVELQATCAYAWPDYAYSVTLQAGANLVFGANDSLTGAKGMQAIADPNIYVDPTATVDVFGKRYNATDLFAVAFSPGFHVPARTWTGGSTSADSWSDGSNWNPSGTLSTADTLAFAGATRLAPDNDLVNQQVAGLVFATTAGEFHLGGNLLKIAGRIEDQSAAKQEINLPVEFIAGNDSGKVNVRSGGELKITAPVSGDQGLTKTGAGQLELTQDVGYTGNTVVQEGTLVLRGITNNNSTTVSGTLVADYIVQDTLTINAGGSVTIRETAPAGSSANQVPEPSAFALLGIAAICLLASAWRHKA